MVKLTKEEYDEAIEAGHTPEEIRDQLQWMESLEQERKEEEDKKRLMNNIEELRERERRVKIREEKAEEKERKLQHEAWNSRPEEPRRASKRQPLHRRCRWRPWSRCLLVALQRRTWLSPF